MSEINGIYNKLIVSDMEEQLPGATVEELQLLNNDEIYRLISYASLLSVSTNYLDISLAYEIITRLIEVNKANDKKLLIASDLLLSRIGNFPGRSLLRKRYFNDDKPLIPISVSFEEIAREAENSMENKEGVIELLTDFQYSLYTAITTGKSISVSAPTSAGKSFVLNLALQQRLTKNNKESIVYIVPTRALISEVSQRIRASVKKSNLEGILIRTAPFPIKKERVTGGVVYVLTQERLASLLYSEEEGLWITSLIIDEAHEIQKRKRGIILQNSIDSVLLKFPQIPILFASPLISNPDYFIDLFNMPNDTGHIIERLSPVAQNIILIDKVDRLTSQARFKLIGQNSVIDLGKRKLSFKYRDSKSFIISNFAISITKNDESTIIFANRPYDAEILAGALIKNLKEISIDEDVDDFIEFIKTEIHSEYLLSECLKKGVAFHYGYMPSIVRSGVEKLFKEEKIKYICCTSTLLQGVNLPAKNIVISNPKSGDDAMTRPDFLNLSGRAGRLLKEFHGNIWCIDAKDWDVQVYKGNQLEEIKSAVDMAMKDGGKIIHDLMGGKIVNNSDLESAELTFTRIYHEITQKGYASVVARYENNDNITDLEKTLKFYENLNISLPYKILEAHKSVRPDHLDLVYRKLVGYMFPLDMSPLNPFKEGAKARFEVILKIISESFSWEIDDSYFSFLSYLTYSWVRGVGLNEIIANRVGFIRNNKDPNKPVSTIIRDLLKTIEHDIRFKMEKYFSVYIDVLKYVLEEKNLNANDRNLEPFHVYLEFGASDKVALNLMALGLSRFTALRLYKHPAFKDIEENSPEDYLRVLMSISVNNGNLPKVCLSEIYELVGV